VVRRIVNLGFFLLGSLNGVSNLKVAADDEDVDAIPASLLA
jgi:hypothetical protein